jgi:hypothetical protein
VSHEGIFVAILQSGAMSASNEARENFHPENARPNAIFSDLSFMWLEELIVIERLPLAVIYEPLCR